MDRKEVKNDIRSQLIQFLKGQNAPEGKRIFDSWAYKIMEQENINPMDEETDKSIKKNLDKRICNYNLHRNKKTIFQNRRFVSMVASIAILIAIGGVLLYTQKQSHRTDETNQLIVVEVPFGEKKTVELADGSVIILNAGSVLEYPEKFSKTERKLKLTGEAFFKVQKETKRPFIITTDQITTTVLGTSFNIYAFKSEDIKVTVATGKVKVTYRSDLESRPKTAILMPGQQAVFNRSSLKLTQRAVEVEDYTGWQNNVLAFNLEPLSLVINKIQRKYNVQFRCDDKAILSKPLKATFGDVDLATVLGEMEFVLDIKFHYQTSDTIEIRND